MLKRRGLVLVGLALSLAVAPFAASNSHAAEEQKFDVLQIGTHTYKNVTVTTKSKDYVFLLHSEGMANLKVKDLSPEVREQLGYIDPPPPKSAATKANDWAKQSLTKIESPQVKAIEQQFQQALTGKSIYGYSIPPFNPRLLWPTVAGVVALYLFFCYTCLSLCRKIGKKPGLLIWLPVLKTFPLLDAANMPAWLFLALLVPGLNLIVAGVWCVKIAKARGYGAGPGILLMLPILNVLVFLFLAFGGGTAPVKEKRRIEIMSLEAA
jgi:hypothetical protein